MPGVKRPAKLKLKKGNKVRLTVMKHMINRLVQNPNDLFGTCPGDYDDVWELCEKVDGSLCNVSVLSNQHPLYRILTDLLGNGKLDIWHCLVGDYLIIPSTKGSDHIPEKMKSTFVTAFWSSLFPKTPLPKPTEKCDDCWGSILKQSFGEAVATIASTNTKGGHLTLHFEMVCPNRTTFDEVCHKELAVRYDRGGAYLFGGMANGKWINEFPTQKSFPTPKKTIIKKPAEAISILESSSPHKERYILNRLTQDGSSLVISCTWKVSTCSGPVCSQFCSLLNRSSRSSRSNSDVQWAH